MSYGGPRGVLEGGAFPDGRCTPVIDLAVREVGLAGAAARDAAQPERHRPARVRPAGGAESAFFIDNLLVRIHLIIEMI